jgi:hypothetical protein
MDPRLLRLALLVLLNGATLLLVIDASIADAVRTGFAASIDVGIVSAMCLGALSCSYGALFNFGRPRLSLVLELCALGLMLIQGLVWVYIWIATVETLAF